MPASSIFGLAGCGLLCLALAAVGFRLQAFPARVRFAALAVAAAAVFAPIGDLSVAAYARGVTGDLSIPTLVQAGTACLGRLSARSLLDPRGVRALLWLLAGVGVFLYPLALGLTPFDPYALGYDSIAFVTVLLIVTAAAWRAGLNLIVLVVLAAG